MPNLTNFSFTKVFDEIHYAGSISVDNQIGMLKSQDEVIVNSLVRGYYCTDLRMLLIEHRAVQFVDGEEMDIESAPKTHVVARRDINITNAVRDLPSIADAWHKMISVWCSNPDIVESEVAK